VLPKPAPDEIDTYEDEKEPEESDKRFGLAHSEVGRITGYVEAYRGMLTGKSDELFRSNGFFVYLRGRLINVEDGHFGISPNELQHGTFARVRVVVHMDGLDDYLQSDRERIREGPVLVFAQNILRAIFNCARQFLRTYDASQEPGAQLASTLAATSGSVSRRPIIEMVRAALQGNATSKYIGLPPEDAKSERDSLVAIEATMSTRDQYLRDVAAGSGPRTALAVANALREARDDEHRLEVELVAAFEKLGFNASRPGRKSAKDRGKDLPDGLAVAVLGGDGTGKSLRYSVTLEAKSTKKDGKRVPARDVQVSVIALHRDKFKADHAIVVAPSFSTTQGADASVARQISQDRDATRAQGTPRTVTLITVDDLARLVRIAPTKRLGLTRLRELFAKCSLPEECRKWIDELETSRPTRPPYQEIIETVYQLQQEHNGSAVKYYGLMVALGHRTPPIKIPQQDLADLCKAMSHMAPGYMSASSSVVGIEQNPTNVLKAVESATKAHLPDGK